MEEIRAIQCLLCGRTSYNRNDVDCKYCGNCHKWLKDREYLLIVVRAAEQDDLIVVRAEKDDNP